jgi:hypothetical protein
VINPFRKKQHPRTDELIHDIRGRLEEMESLLKRMEQQLSQPECPHPGIQIETVHIHQPVLENLEFRLDALDIDQLSGSLNLGNNFGTKWIRSRSTSKAKSGSSSTAANSEPSKEKIHPTSSGYRWNNRG